VDSSRGRPRHGGSAVSCVVVGLAIAAFGCDGADQGGSGKGGAEIKIGTSGPDKYDPVLFQTVQAAEPLQLVYTPLLTYRHEEGQVGSELIAGLAQEIPEPSNGGKTYTFKLREGLEYSDGSGVKASDFENTMKRLFKLGSVWSGFFSGIVGAEVFQEEGNFKADIEGIETNDQTGEITINLTEPDTKVLFALAEPYAAPTPAAKSPPKTLTENPPPGFGPYTIEVVDPRRKFILRKNPDFDLPDIPKGNFDRIEGIVSRNVTKTTQDVIDGKLDFMTEDPTGDQLPEIRRKYMDRFREEANPPNIYFFFLNTSIPPFDKLEARQAVNYALDSNALARLFGGRLKPSCNFLPPAVIGYRELDCDYGDPAGPPEIDKGKELVKKSGYAGTKVTVWTDGVDPHPAIADYYRDVLHEIGFEAETKALDAQVYFGLVGVKRTKAQTGFTNWFQDYPHPGDFIETQLSTRALKSEVTNNQSFVSDPELDKQLEELRGKDPKTAADKWAELDDYIVNKKAYVAPYGNEESSSFFSERMDAQHCAGIHPVWKNDWLLFCLK
jgi:peptide/nickel transport system substrate-binding protein